MRKAFPSLLLAAAASIAVARADDLVTRDGTVYHNYRVLSHDAGFVTIMDSDGGGKIPLSNLPDNLQKEYGYNKQAADAAVQAAIAQDRQDRQAIAQEQAQRQQQLAAQAQAQAAQVQAQPGTPTATPSDSQTAPPVLAPGGVAPVVAVSIKPSNPPPQAAAAPVAPSPNADVTPPGVLTDKQVADINQQIKELRAELDMERREMAHEVGQTGDNSVGAAGGIIESDKEKIDELKKQLIDSERAAQRALISRKS